MNNGISFWKIKKVKPFLNLKSYPKRTKQEIRLIDRNPFGDADRDKVPNMFDCKPLNKSQRGFLESPKKKRNIEQLKKIKLPMLVANKGQKLIVDRGIVKGSVLYGTSKTYPGEAYLMGIDILPKERRKGYGRKAIESIFKDTRVKTLYGLSTPKAKGFYKKLGAIFDTGQMETHGGTLHPKAGFEIKKEDFEKVMQNKKIRQINKRVARPSVLKSLPEEQIPNKFLKSGYMNEYGEYIHPDGIPDSIRRLENKMIKETDITFAEMEEEVEKHPYTEKYIRGFNAQDFIDIPEEEIEEKIRMSAENKEKLRSKMPIDLKNKIDKLEKVKEQAESEEPSAEDLLNPEKNIFLSDEYEK